MIIIELLLMIVLVECWMQSSIWFNIVSIWFNIVDVVIRIVCWLNGDWLHMSYELLYCWYWFWLVVSLCDWEKYYICNWLIVELLYYNCILKCLSVCPYVCVAKWEFSHTNLCCIARFTFTLPVCCLPPWQTSWKATGKFSIVCSVCVERG